MIWTVSLESGFISKDGVNTADYHIMFIFNSFSEISEDRGGVSNAETKISSVQYHNLWWDNKGKISWDSLKNLQNSVTWISGNNRAAPLYSYCLLRQI